MKFEHKDEAKSNKKVKKDRIWGLFFCDTVDQFSKSLQSPDQMVMLKIQAHND